MPSILQLRSIDYDDIAETLFFGGTSLTARTAESFETSMGDFTVTFTGTGFAYAADGTLSAGELEEYRVHEGGVAIGNQLVIVSSNFILLDATEFSTAMALFSDGQTDAAVELVTDSWLAEFFSHSNASGGRLFGYQGNESLSGGGGRDFIYGLAGNDSISLGVGNDRGFGGLGTDRIFGFDGEDFAAGGPGMDFLHGGDGDDRLFGGQGVDTLNGDRGSDRLSGQDGDDFLSGDNGDDFLFGGAGDDDLRGDDGFDTLRGGTGNDDLEGGRRDDRLFGGQGDDTLKGESGHDYLFGGRGDDSLDGGRGADILESGAGNDQLTGGFGEDSFVIRENTGAVVEILDFFAGTDTLDLTAFNFSDEAALSAAADQVGRDLVFDLGDGQVLTIVRRSLDDVMDDILF